MATEQEIINKLRLGVGSEGGYSTAEEWRAARAAFDQSYKAGEPTALAAGGPGIVGGTLIAPDPRTGEIIKSTTERSGARKLGALPEIQAAYAPQPIAPVGTVATQEAISGDRQIESLLNQLMGASRTVSPDVQALTAMLMGQDQGAAAMPSYGVWPAPTQEDLMTRAEGLGQVAYGGQIAALQEAMREVDPEYQKAMKSIDDYQKYMAKEFDEYANARGMFRSTIPMQMEKELVERTLGPQRQEIEEQRLRTLDSLNREIARLTGEQGLYTASTYMEMYDRERAFQLDHAKFMEGVRQFESSLGLDKVRMVLDEAHKDWSRMMDTAEIMLTAKDLEKKWGNQAEELYLKTLDHDLKVEQFLAERADQDWLKGFKERELALETAAHSFLFVTVCVAMCLRRCCGG